MKYIKGYDTLRAISIILVLLSHLGLYHYLPKDSYIRERVWLLISGETGVQIFFALSGFLITLLLLKEKERNHTINLKNFYIRRFLRLLPPLLVLYLVVGIFMLFDALPVTPIEYIVSFFYLSNFLPTHIISGELGHTWSLAIEEQFYFTWPFLLNLFSKFNSLVIVIFITITLCFAGYLIMPHISIFDGFKTSRFFIPAVAPIMTGSLFAILHKTNIISRKSSKLIILLSIIGFAYPLYSPTVLLSIAPIIQSAGISFFLFWIIRHQKSRFISIFDNSVLRYIGKISYGLYVYQGFFLRTGPAPIISVQEFPINIILTFVVAIISFELYERPILSLKSRFY